MDNISPPQACSHNFYNTKLQSLLHKLGARQWLGEDVRQLLFSSDAFNFDLSFLCTLSDIVISSINVLASFMKHRILDESNGGLAINLQCERLGALLPQLPHQLC